MSGRNPMCKRGHSLANAYVRPDGNGRNCRACERIRAHTHKGDSRRLSGFSLDHLARRDWDMPRPAARVRRVCVIHRTELRESINPDRLQCDTCGLVVDFDTLNDEGHVLARVRAPEVRVAKDGELKLTPAGVRNKALRRKSGLVD